MTWARPLRAIEPPGVRSTSFTKKSKVPLSKVKWCAVLLKSMVSAPLLFETTAPVRFAVQLSLVGTVPRGVVNVTRAEWQGVRPLRPQFGA